MAATTGGACVFSLCLIFHCFVYDEQRDRMVVFVIAYVVRFVGSSKRRSNSNSNSNENSHKNNDNNNNNCYLSTCEVAYTRNPIYVVIKNIVVGIVKNQLLFLVCINVSIICWLFWCTHTLVQATTNETIHNYMRIVTTLFRWLVLWPSSEFYHQSASMLCTVLPNYMMQWIQNNTVPFLSSSSFLLFFFFYRWKTIFILCWYFPAIAVSWNPLFYMFVVDPMPLSFKTRIILVVAWIDEL